MYPYGHSHCCLKQLGLSLQVYAESNNGHFPAGAGCPEASLGLLARGNYDADANVLRGKTVDETTVQSLLDASQPLGPASCGWHYVEGLTLADDPRLAVVWDKVGLGHNGEDLHGGHSAWRLAGHEEIIPAGEWTSFLARQARLMAARSTGALNAAPALRATIKLPTGEIVEQLAGPYVLRTDGGKSTGTDIGPAQLRWYRLPDRLETYTLEVAGRKSKPIEVDVVDGIATPDEIVFELE